ncbi:MAG: UDP-N-acetylglucosamine 1-carboxyvinyltransferase [Coriobacteriales bacterium]|nr:UDP-N-acetylglucosamine 1-carboxyvinyltransferase [Coriobacteriales bacterium]
MSLIQNNDVIRIVGCQEITGDVLISGAKNSVLKLMAASLLTDGQTCIKNTPLISDVRHMGEVLRYLGADVSFADNAVQIDTSSIQGYEAPYELVSQMRASIAVLGPLIARFGRARVAMPGGCNIGSRKLDIHITALEALGVQFDVDAGFIIAETPYGLKGSAIKLTFPSVGATENLIMAAVRADGETIISNAAREPEIVDLANYLSKMGAEIQGAGSSQIIIHGTNRLEPVKEHVTVGDRIEAGTFLVAGALMGNPVKVRGINPEHLEMALQKFEDMGVEVAREADSITVWRERPLQAVSIQTLPFPGFPTDLQTQFMVLCCLAGGESKITENIFENRFQLANELVRMGAHIDIQNHFAYIQGVHGLSGVPVKASDLRGGAALVLAGLVADGVTEVSGVEHIDRGYEDFTKKLVGIGANVTRVIASSADFDLVSS